MAARKETVMTDIFDEFEAVDTSKLALAPVGRGEARDPTEAKRQKMVEGVEIQLNLWRDPKWKMERTVYKPVEGRDGRTGVQESYRPREWWRPWNGQFIITPRFGVRPFELQPGKTSYSVPGEKMEAFLNAIIDQVKMGRYDEMLMDLGSRKRRKGED